MCQQQQHEVRWACLLTRVGDGEETAGAGVEHGHDSRDKDARGQLPAEQKADDRTQTNL